MDVRETRIPVNNRTTSDKRRERRAPDRGLEPASTQYCAATPCVEALPKSADAEFIGYERIDSGSMRLELHQSR